MRENLGMVLALAGGVVATLGVLWLIGRAYGQNEEAASTRRIGVVYSVLFIPTLIGAVAVEFLSLSLATAIGTGARWLFWPLNTLPALGAGLALYLPLARRMGRRSSPVSFPRRHLYRAGPLYLVATLLAAHIAFGVRDANYWLFGQIVLWPCLAAVGALVADALASSHEGKFIRADA